MSDLAVEHDAPQHRYVAVLDGEAIGEAVYRDTDEGRVFVHSEIVPELEHHGYGTRMVRAAVDDTRRSGLRPIGRCSMVRNFLAEHPDTARPASEADA